MNHQVESVKPERVDRRRGKSAEPGPGVVGVDGPVGEAEPRQIEGDSTQATGRELGDDLAVEERRGGHAMQADDRLARPLLTDETSDGGGCEAPARASMGLDDRVNRGHEVTTVPSGGTAPPKTEPTSRITYCGLA